MNGWRIIDESTQQWLTWQDGSLSGSDDAFADVGVLEQQGRVSFVPGVTVKADRRSESSSYIMALLILPHGTVTGEPPDLNIPVLPEGAVG